MITKEEMPSVKVAPDTGVATNLEDKSSAKEVFLGTGIVGIVVLMALVIKNKYIKRNK